MFKNIHINLTEVPCCMFLVNSEVRKHGFSLILIYYDYTST